MGCIFGDLGCLLNLISLVAGENASVSPRSFYFILGALLIGAGIWVMLSVNQPFGIVLIVAGALLVIITFVDNAEQRD